MEIKVIEEEYTSPDTAVCVDGKWMPAKPELLSPNIIESFNHWRGKHLSFGQPYCVICGKKQAT